MAAAARPSRGIVAPLSMCEAPAPGAEEGNLIIDEASGDFFGVDAEGNKVKLTLEAEEKYYLDACNAYYNDKKPILSNDEFDALREELAFSGSDVATMNRMEVMFMVAANRYAEGKPVMSDEEFDNIRRKLKARNSLAVVHKVPTCRVDTNTCKADLTVDGFKNAALYIPAVGIVTPICIMITVIQELINGPMGPLVGLIVNLPIIAAVSYVVKNFIIFQEPLVTSGSCPLCYTNQNVYFGDIVFCKGDSGKADEINTQCINTACACQLKASRSRMVIESALAKETKPAAA